MTTAFLKSTAAAALVMLSVGAQAAEVTLDFSGLVTNAPTSVAAKIAGFQFSGATAWTATVATGANDPKPGGVNLDPKDAFIATRDKDGNFFDIDVKLADTNVGRYLSSVSFNLFVGGTGQPVMDVYAGDLKLNSPSISGGSGGNLWSVMQTHSFAEAEKIDRIRFYSGTSGQSGLLGLDNLGFDFYGTGNTPNVPEPASYALVALALLAAGGASRRRKA